MSNHEVKDLEKPSHHEATFEDDSQHEDEAPVEWTLMRICAIISLAGIYVGQSLRFLDTCGMY